MQWRFVPSSCVFAGNRVRFAAGDGGWVALLSSPPLQRFLQPSSGQTCGVRSVNGGDTPGSPALEIAAKPAGAH